MTNRTEVLNRMRQTGVVAVVRAPSAEDAGGLVDAVRAGGIDIIEITMTVPGAIAVIESLVNRFGASVIIGAGTVLDVETAQACMRAGAQFIVSPALDVPTIESCRNHGVPVIPGAMTPTEIVSAHRAGADIVKVFPCGAVGGPAYIKSLRTPLPQIDLMPTGGVTSKNVGDFIRAGACAVGAGTDLADIRLYRAGNLDAIRANAAAYLQAIREARSPSPRDEGGPAAHLLGR